MTDREIEDLAIDIHCGVMFARDLLRLAGGDANMVRQASENCHSANEMKVYIIDRRFSKLES